MDESHSAAFTRENACGGSLSHGGRACAGKVPWVTGLPSQARCLFFNVRAAGGELGLWRDFIVKRRSYPSIHPQTVPNEVKVYGSDGNGTQQSMTHYVRATG